MTNERALRPVESGPGVLVHPAADRQLATSHWLLSTLRHRDRARMEWQEHGLTMLPLGTLFSAVRLPQRLVLAVAGGTGPSAEVDAVLGEALGDGPVICDPHGRRYYALVPPSMPVTWHQAVDEWRVVDVDCLGRDTYLGVPRVDLTTFDRRTFASYWAVPMPSLATLCAPLAVARLIAAGQHQLDKQEADEEGPA
ncbi:hypothetical protein KBY55_09665 [Streptomyces sp. b94]|uniref:hypothetical protein n=1 Tax=Streptomyces sp. b94 TaxID=1827634 RepID=UPI001B37527E|nr:hypothetical protein [Streptomyces sp. b94]MBQ1096351.1 hypothetical protein [Streptomyces sp. b94]